MLKNNQVIFGVVAGLVITALAWIPLAVNAANHEIVPLWGPYLTSVTETGITVNWRTEEETDGIVEYATEGFYSANSAYSHAVSDTMRELHHVVLTGLEPDTRYHYRLRIGEEHTADHTFTTLGDGPFTFIVYGDTREQIPYYTQLERHKLVADRIAEEENISFVIHTGDLVCGGEDLEEWGRFFQATRQMLCEIPIYPVAGNHENSSQYYDDFFGMPSWYSFECGDAHFAMLDTNTGIDLQAETQWLTADISGSSRWKFATFHHPPYSSDSQHWGGHLDIRDLWEPVFMENGLNAVFNAHVHVYERYYEKGIHYIVLGNGGAPFYRLAEEKIAGYRNSLEYTLGYARITIDGDEAFMDVIKVAEVSTETNEVSQIYPPNTVFERVSLQPEPLSDNATEETHGTELPHINISIDRETIDYGDIFPGESSAMEIVEISNNGTLGVKITLEINGEALARDFFQQSLYINNSTYRSGQVICSIPAESDESVTTQMKVPSQWSEPGLMEATFVFWAEAS
jgi:hypothetical protein